MAIPTNKAWMGQVWGALLLTATVTLCLVYSGLREGPSLSLRDLEDTQTVLMSCARDAGPLSSGELLWCSESDSPACAPALPASSLIDLSEAPPFTLAGVPHVELTPVASFEDHAEWRRPLAASAPSSGVSMRLERPPRA